MKTMKNLYGEYTQNQIAQTKKALRKTIFLLLLCVDPETADQYKSVDVNKSFKGLQLKINGFNELLLYQPEIVSTMSLLQSAMIEYNKPDFDFKTYRKLILDAGAEINKLREED